MAADRRADPDAPDRGRVALALLRAAVRRFLTLLAILVAGTVVVSLVVGTAIGSTVDRSISVGLYLVGSFMLVAGFFVGNRGPVRPRGHGATPFLGARMMRWATPDEREEQLNESAIYVVLGLVLIVLGVVADNRYTLV